MKRYLFLYNAILKICLVREMEFRINFIIRILINFLWAGISYATVFLIYSQVDSIGGWNREQMVLLTSVVGLSNSVYKLFFHNSITRFQYLVNSGELDFMLLKPVNARFLASMRQFGFEQLPRGIMFIYLIIVLSKSINFSISNMDMVFGFILVILGSFAIYNLVFSIYCYVFWKPRVWNLFAINVELQNLGNNPSQIYKGFLGVLVYV
ncbi:ABC-2 family transporter protein, partial [Romboutsia sp.]|uniref:ABC-2 family transporter protein n=1 Tax=Romboutsia sp. TaxID=1965302 RepID=UPI002B511707